MLGSFAYSRVPGQLVNPVSRWPEIARSFTWVPSGYFGLPPDDQLTSESGSTCATSSRQASSDTSARCAAGVIDVAP